MVTASLRTGRSTARACRRSSLRCSSRRVSIMSALAACRLRSLSASCTVSACTCSALRASSSRTPVSSTLSASLSRLSWIAVEPEVEAAPPRGSPTEVSAGTARRDVALAAAAPLPRVRSRSAT